MNTKIARILAHQDGVIARRHALGAGLSESGIDRRVRSGEWIRQCSGVYRAATQPPSPRTLLRTAVYASGPDAAAFGPSAAWWFGLVDKAPAKNWITVPRHRAGHRTDRNIIWRRDLADFDRTNVRGLPITSYALAVLDASVILPNGSTVMDRALQTKAPLSALVEAHHRNGRRKGATEAAKLLRIAASGGRSEAERIVHRMLRQARIGGWQAAFAWGGYELDIAFEEVRLAIEIDGWAWHSDVERFNHDRKRQNLLINNGWRVLRFTWHQLNNEPHEVIAAIRQALAA